MNSTSALTLAFVSIEAVISRIVVRLPYIEMNTAHVFAVSSELLSTYGVFPNSCRL